MTRARSSPGSSCQSGRRAIYMRRDFLQQIDIRVLEGRLPGTTLYVDEPVGATGARQVASYSVMHVARPETGLPELTLAKRCFVGGRRPAAGHAHWLGFRGSVNRIAQEGFDRLLREQVRIADGHHRVDAA